MKLNRTKNELNREARNNENENWDVLEGLGHKLDSIYDDFDDIVTKAAEGLNTNIINKIKNGDFSDGLNNFIVGNGNGEVINGIVRLKNKSTSGNGARLFQRLLDTAPTDTWYIKTRARALDEGADWIAVGFRGGESGSDRSQIDNPEINKWYELSHLYDGSVASNFSGVFTGSVWSYWEDSLNKSIDVDYLLAINLTEAYGKGKEPSKDVIDILLGGTSYFEGDLGAGRLSKILFSRYLEMEKSLKEIEEKGNSKLENMIFNGNFKYGIEGWERDISGEISNEGNKLILVGEGNSYITRAKQTIMSDYDVGDILFVDGNFRATNPDCYQMGFALYSASQQNMPYVTIDDFTPNENINIKGNVTIPSNFYGDLILQIRARYPDTATAIGKAIEVKDVSLINLTKFFGKGNEPNANEMKKLLDSFPDGFIDNQVSVADTQKALVQFITSRKPEIPSIDLRKPLIALTFDDAFKTDYDLVFPRLQARGINATSYIWTSRVSNHGRSMTWENLHELKNAGWGIECHTHDHLHLDRLTDGEIHEQMQLVDQSFIDNGFPKPRHHAYPFGSGAGDERVMNIIKQYRKTARSTGGIPSYNNYDNINFYNLHAKTVDINNDNYSRLALRKSDIDATVANKGILILFAHEQFADVEDANQDWRGYIEYLLELIDYARDKDVEFVTIEELYQRLLDYQMFTTE